MHTLSCQEPILSDLYGTKGKQYLVYMVYQDFQLLFCSIENNTLESSL